MDNVRNPDHALAVRNGFFIYHGWSDPYSARNCDYNGVGKRYSRTEGCLESLWLRMDGRRNVSMGGPPPSVVIIHLILYFLGLRRFYAPFSSYGSWTPTVGKFPDSNVHKST